MQVSLVISYSSDNNERPLINSIRRLCNQNCDVVRLVQHRKPITPTLQSVLTRKVGRYPRLTRRLEMTRRRRFVQSYYPSKRTLLLSIELTMSIVSQRAPTHVLSLVASRRRDSIHPNLSLYPMDPNDHRIR